MKNVWQTGNNQDSGVLSNPLSFLHSGYFRWSNADLINRGWNGSYWSFRSTDDTRSYLLAFSDILLASQHNDYRGNGFAVRFVVNPSPLSLILAIL